jgi:hypothetical protein
MVEENPGGRLMPSSLEMHRLDVDGGTLVRFS